MSSESFFSLHTFNGMWTLEHSYCNKSWNVLSGSCLIGTVRNISQKASYIEFLKKIKIHAVGTAILLFFEIRVPLNVGYFRHSDITGDIFV